MIQMFVHSPAPLLWGEIAKERVGRPSTLSFRSLTKLPDLEFELFLFAQTNPRVGYLQRFVGGTVSREWLLIRVNWLDQRSDHPPDQYARAGAAAPAPSNAARRWAR